LLPCYSKLDKVWVVLLNCAVKWYWGEIVILLDESVKVCAVADTSCQSDKLSWNRP